MMPTIRAVLGAVKPLDVVVAAPLVAISILLMQAQVGVQVGVPVDGVTIESNSVWLHLLTAAPLAVLWWRRSVVGVVLVAAGVVLLHTLAFGQVIRCGAGLPLAFVMSFLAGYQVDRAKARWALFAVEVLAFVVLIDDAAAGLEIYPPVAVMCAGGWWVASLAKRRSTMAQELRVRNEELRALRDQRAALQVTGDRARLSGELDSLLTRRLGQLTTLAEAGTRLESPTAAHAILGQIEDQGRRTLEEMREIVGALRGGDVALSPAPSVAHLDALLAQHGARLAVSGDPQGLPASVELSAYRLVEHLLSVLERDPGSPVDVRMAFDEDALEVSITGKVARGADVRGAVARARERARLQEGTLNVKVSRGRARAIAHFPVTV